MYSGQNTYNPEKANACYEFLPSDSSRLYRKYSRVHDIDTSQLPQYNVDNWLNMNSPGYKPEIASAVFHYHARAEKDDHLQICIQTKEMKQASWKYAHQNQLILDGTFRICNSQVLLFIVLGIDGEGKGVPLAFFMFSAPMGNRATQSEYDILILKDLFKSWQDSLGSHNGSSFTPQVAITDMDTKERGALTIVWPDIWLILCKFHVRQCWTNRRKKLLHMGRIPNFPKQQVQARLRMLEEQ